MKTIEISNKAGKIRLNETVTQDSMERLLDEIGKLFGATTASAGADYGEIMNAAENGIDTLEIELNSPGGSVFAGYALHAEIKSLIARGVTVNALITGMAASMCSVIAMACSKVAIVKHGRMMIHDAASGCQGNADAMRKQADLLDGISADIANIYAERTGKPVDEVRGMMKKETWMNASTCLESHFVDEVVDIGPASQTKAHMHLLDAIKSLLPSVNNDDADKLAAHVAEVDSIAAELSDAQAQIAELTNLSAVVAEKDLEIANLTAASTAFQAEIKAKAAVIVEMEDDLRALNDSLTEDKASAGAQAIELLAAIGQSEPLPDTDAPATLTKTRAEFHALSPSEKSSFSINGGKIK